MAIKDLACTVLIVTFGFGETICVFGHHAEFVEVHVLEEPPGPFNFAVGSAVEVEEQSGSYTLDAQPGAFSVTGMSATVET